MATDYKVCRSTRRIAMLDAFPYGADYPYHAEVFEVRFRDNGIEMTPEPKCIAKAYCGFPCEIESILKSFGLEWSDAASFIDALGVLVDDYEERAKCVRVRGLGV